MTDVQTEASFSSETEKGNSPVLAFLNDDVASLSWQDLSVKVSDGSCQCLYASELQAQCKISGAAVLEKYGYAAGKEGEWVGILLGIIAVYRVLAWGVIWYKRS
jgi:hypothetical protein